jgi:hypothetical protein
VDSTKEPKEIKALIPPVEPTIKNYRELAEVLELTPRPRNSPSKATPSRVTTSSFTASTQTESGAGTPLLKQLLVLLNGIVPLTFIKRQDLSIMISLYLA